MIVLIIIIISLFKAHLAREVIRLIPIFIDRGTIWADPMQMARRSKATNAFTCLSRSPSSGIPPDWLIDDCFEDKDRRRLDRSPRAPPSTCFQSRLDQNYKPIQLSKRQLFRDDILPHILIPEFERRKRRRELFLHRGSFPRRSIFFKADSTTSLWRSFDKWR